MAVTSINVGTLANDGTGDDLREAFIKVNNNFTVKFNKRIDAKLKESISVVFDVNQGHFFDIKNGNII